MKSSLDVYCKLAGTMQYVGKTQNAKTLSPGVEIVEWFDNTRGTQVLYALDIDKVAPQFKFSFMQVTNKNTLTLALNADTDVADPNFDWGFLGSGPDAFTEAEWRFVGRSVDGRNITMVIPRGIAYSTGDITMGTPGSYSEVPITVRALQDTTITDTKRDLMYWFIDKRKFS